MGSRVGLEGCGKSLPPPEFDPRTVQPVASRYADYSTPVVIKLYKFEKKIKYKLKCIRPDNGCFVQPKHVAAIGFAMIKSCVSTDCVLIIACFVSTKRMSHLKVTHYVEVMPLPLD